MNVYSIPADDISGFTAANRYMQVTDLYNDSLPGIQVSDGNGLHCYKNNGSFSFTRVQTIGFLPHGVIAQDNWFSDDMDGDGDQDFVVSFNDVTNIYFNNSGIIDTTRYETFTTQTNVVGVADMNSDHKPDLIVNQVEPIQRAYILFNHGDNLFDGDNYIKYPPFGGLSKNEKQ